MGKYLDKSGLRYFYGKLKEKFADKTTIEAKLDSLTGAFLWKGKFDTLPPVYDYEAGNVVAVGKKEYVLTVTGGTKTWEEFGDEGSYLLKTAAEETYLKKTAGEVKTANLADKAVTENKLNDDLRSKVNNNVKTITQTLTDTQKAQARQNLDVLEVTQQDIDNLPGGGLNPISDNTTPEVQKIETLLGFDVNGNISKTKTIDTEHLATGAATTPKIADGAVTSDKIADYAVIEKKIASGAITNDKIMAGAVSADKLNTDLLSMINSLGAGYQFIGVATPTTNPENPDAKVFYIANGKGTYTNFSGLEVTEDDVVVLIWDSSWHKVSTGIASNDKLTELDSKIKLEATARTDADKALQTQINGKQEALTLTVKDNGNIVLANIQGQSKEFMPATPSGDPMHYAYVAAGAKYNGTGKDIVKTAPWADMLDDDADKTVVHKAGYWYLNGLGDITNEQMRVIFIETNNFMEDISQSAEARYCSLISRTHMNPPIYHITTGRLRVSYRDFVRSSINLESIIFPVYKNSIDFCFRPTKLTSAFSQCINLKYIYGVINLYDCTEQTNVFYLSPNIRICQLNKLRLNLNINNLDSISSKSILYMIQNEAATSAITITLHADAYARAMANADIVAALEAHPNVSLASA